MARNVKHTALGLFTFLFCGMSQAATDTVQDTQDMSTWWLIALLVLAAIAIVVLLLQLRSRHLQTEQTLAGAVQDPGALRQKKLELLDINNDLRNSNEALQRANAELALALESFRHLSEIGFEITHSTDTGVVYQALQMHIGLLLDAPQVSIYRLNPEGTGLELVFGAGPEDPLAETYVSLASTESLLSRVARERKELFVNAVPDQHLRDDLPPKEAGISALFSPLLIGSKLLGLVAIQFASPHSYDERKKLVLRTLCAYGAMAIENVEAARQLDSTKQTLDKTRAQMRRQAKAASIGTLTAGLSHEINNPVNFIYVGSQNLRQHLIQFNTYLVNLLDDNADVEIKSIFQQHLDHSVEALDVILDGATQIRDLVLNLRTFSRLDEADMKEVEIAAGILSTINLVRVQYRDEVDIVCQFDANPLIRCWPARLNQVFMNLIINACQAINSRPLNAQRLAPGSLKIRSAIINDLLAIEFEDNGIGMTHESQQHLFDPHYTTKNIEDGMGLGLSIVRNIIEQHKGSIQVRSIVGEGSCFTLYLPLHFKAAEQG
ncbi:sensor histidine kinase [Undibacterium sp. TJN19]|uniref:sensor histidine kinase n=1 Tax=Undibacterium sp. TJN19 TaxID=3413055 RepID=UPI003BF38875